MLATVAQSWDHPHLLAAYRAVGKAAKADFLEFLLPPKDLVNWVQQMSSRDQNDSGDLRQRQNDPRQDQSVLAFDLVFRRLCLFRRRVFPFLDDPLYVTINDIP